MKKAILVVVSSLSFMLTSAQEALPSTSSKSMQKRTARCKPFSLGIPLGIDANAGLAGVAFEYGFCSQFSIGAGAGVGSWGYKYFGEGKYYFDKSCYKGSAIGIAYTYATGMTDLEIKNVKTVYDERDLVFDLDPVSNLALAYYHYWAMGRYSRFYISAGYSVCLSSVSYTVKTYAPPLSSQAKTAMNVIAPGGIVLGAGFYFGL